jgi:sRNA-binding protein
MATEKLAVKLGTHKSASTLVLPAGYKLTDKSYDAIAKLTRQFPNTYWKNPDKKHNVIFIGITSLLEDILDDVLALAKITPIKAATEVAAKKTPVAKKTPAAKKPATKKATPRKTTMAPVMDDEEFEIG